METIIKNLYDILEILEVEHNPAAHHKLSRIIDALGEVKSIGPDNIRIMTREVSAPGFMPLIGQIEVEAVAVIKFSSTCKPEDYKKHQIDIDARLKEMLLGSIYGRIE